MGISMSDLEKKSTTFKEAVKNNKIGIVIYLLSFVIPMILMGLIYESQGIGYGKQTTVLTSDLQGQYMPFISQIRFLLENPKNILFNWNYSIGGNYMGIFSYHLANPLNLLTVLWQIKDLPQAIFVLELIKSGLCGLTFNVFLHSRFKRLEATNLLFVVCYALMSFNLVYSFCIMWMDAIILLPLVICGIHKIVEGKAGALYFVSIFAVFATNYYMAYMVGIFCACYFLGILVLQSEKGKMKRSVGCMIRFGINTLLALGLSMPLILPALYNTRYRDLTTDGVEYDQFYHFSIMDLLKKLLPSQYDTIYNAGGRPYIFAGSIVLILAMVYFLQKRKWQEKVVNGMLLMIVFAGFLSQKVDYLWHGFRYPHAFPYRYAFLFGFLVITLGHDAFCRLKLPDDKRGLIVGVAFVYTTAELFMNGTAIISGILREAGYQTSYVYEVENSFYEPLVEKVKEDQGFYRAGVSEVEGGDINHVNNGSLYGYNGFDTYESTIHSGVAGFCEKMGAVSHLSALSQQGFTPFMDSIMGIKYKMAYGDPYGLYNEIMEGMYKDFSPNLYENDDALSLGYLLGEGYHGQAPTWSRNPFENQNQLLQYLGFPDVKLFDDVPYEPELEQVENVIIVNLHFTAPENQPLCFYFDGTARNGGVIEFCLDDRVLFDTVDSVARSVHVLPTITDQEEHVLQVIGELGNVDGIYIGAFNEEVYNSTIQTMQERDFEQFVSDGNRMSGVITAKEPSKMMLTLGYDDGYKIYVDGNQVSFQPVLGAFVGFDVPAGNHKVDIEYIPAGLQTGFIMFGVAGLGAVVYFWLYRKKVK